MPRLSDVLRDGALRVVRSFGRVAEHDASALHGRADRLGDVAESAGENDLRIAKTVDRADGSAGQPRRIESDGRPPIAVPDLSSVPGVDELLRVPTLDNRWLREQLSGLEQRYGPYRMRITDASYFGPKTSGGPAVTGFRFNGDIVDDAGQRVGRLEWHINTDQGTTVAFNTHLRLEPAARGQGFSKSFTTAIRDYYRRSGVNRMELHAVQDGSVAWARAGFDFDRDPAKLARTVSSLRERIAAIHTDLSPADRKQLTKAVKHLERGGPGSPTARDLVELTGDDPKLGTKLMKGTSWHGVQTLST
ncbi:hypothetical protein [Nocardia sp. NBC_00511]|uniref:hypothetical protein n=1 Tax=Nocardia sp. NBC_00511 TaxID=2903591 RepID=UPI0030E1325F